MSKRGIHYEGRAWDDLSRKIDQVKAMGDLIFAAESGDSAMFDKTVSRAGLIIVDLAEELEDLLQETTNEETKPRAVK